MKALVSLILLASILSCPAPVSFDATNDILGFGTLSDGCLRENQACTVSIWGYVNGNGESNAGTLVNRNTWNFRLDTTLAIRFQQVGGTTLVRSSNTSSVSSGAWHHFLMTWDGSTTAANVHIYVDGTEVSYATTTNGATPTDNSGNAISIGNNSATSATWDGFLAECAIWTSVLSSAEIAILAKSPRTDMPTALVTQPLHYWKLNEFGDGATVTGTGVFKDYVAYSYNGSGTNSPTGKASNWISYR